MARKDVRTLRDEAARAASEGKHKRALECYLELEQREPAEASWPKRAAETYRRLGKSRDAVAAYDRAADRYAQGGFLVQAIAVSKIALQIDPAHEAIRVRLARISEQQEGTRSQAGTLADRHRGVNGIADPPRATPRATEPPPRDEDLAPAPALLDELLAPLPAPRPARGSSTESVFHLAEEPDFALEADPFIESPSKPFRLDRGAPLDSVALGEVVPGAHHQRREDGSSSGIIVIPLDDEAPTDTIEIHAVTVEPGPDSGAEIPLPPDGEPEELSLEDLEEVADLPEPRLYSAAAQRALAATPLFASLPPAALEALIDRLSLVDLPAGDILFHQGDRGDALYVIVEGEVAVCSEGPPAVEMTRLGPGAFFGEVALVTEQPRSATILATEASQLLAIDRGVVGELIEHYPDVLRVVLRFLRERLVDRLVQTHPLFAAYGDAERRELVSRFRFIEIELGTTIVEQGARASGLYALLAGKADVRRRGIPVATLGPGDLFGEVSVLTNEASDVAITAATRCLALCLPAVTFREIIMTHPQFLSYVGELVDERRRDRRDSSITLV